MHTFSGRAEKEVQRKKGSNQRDERETQSRVTETREGLQEIMGGDFQLRGMVRSRFEASPVCQTPSNDLRCKNRKLKRHCHLQNQEKFLCGPAVDQ